MNAVQFAGLIRVRSNSYDELTKRNKMVDGTSRFNLYFTTTNLRKGPGDSHKFETRILTNDHAFEVAEGLGIDVSRQAVKAVNSAAVNFFIHPDSNHPDVPNWDRLERSKKAVSAYMDLHEAYGREPIVNIVV